MIISESSINLSSQHSSVEEYHKKESLTYWKTGDGQKVREGRPDNPGKSKTKMMFHESSVKVSLSSESVEMSSVKKIEEAEQEEMTTDLNMRVLKAMIERITGKKIRVFKHVAENEHISAPKSSEGVNGNGSEIVKNDEGQVESPGFGLAYDLHESYYESESTSFNASGKVLTSDGEEIEFEIDLNMSREFYEEQNVSIRMGEALKDPLVVNFNGTAAQLTQTKFSFDIDSNGTAEQISFVTPDSGFLALDKNNDGVVNNGSELFGARTGNGFNELAEYDDDSNGWIDENDSIYQDLRIWVKDHAGENQLFAIGEKGIGAIFLGNVSTSFDMKTEQNELLGQVKSSGIFLREDYSVGTVQQVDLVV